MRRLTSLVVVTVVCWGLAMACSGGSGVPPPPPPTDDGASGQVNPLVPGGGGGGADVVLPVLAMEPPTIGGKKVEQYGVYAAGELKAHVSDAKAQATAFRWTLMGPGISGDQQYADGADFSRVLPVVTGQSAYDLIVIGSLAGNTVQQKISFFTVPAPTVMIKAVVNAAGLPVDMNPDDVVLKDQKILVSANSQYADAYKWSLIKNDGAVAELGQNPTMEFTASDIGSYKVLLTATGPGGHTDGVFTFNANDNAVAINVTSAVTKDGANYGALKNDGKYPVGSTLTIDASGIKPAKGLESMSCVLTDPAGKAQPFSGMIVLNAAGKNTVACTYKINADYVEAAGKQFISSVTFDVLAKAKATILGNDGKACTPNAPAVFATGTWVMFTAFDSSGNITGYTWSAVLADQVVGSLIGDTLKALQFPLALKTEGTYTITLGAEGLGDSDSATCTVIAKPKPAVTIALDSTVQSGRSYMLKSFQSAHADVKTGLPDLFSWNLADEKGASLKKGTTTDAATRYEFGLIEAGPMTLTMTPSAQSTVVGDPSSVTFASKMGQVSLITPIKFSSIQSIAAVSDADVYFASSSAIFHKGMDGRVVQVKNISAHLAQPDGFFARNAGDIYLLTTDGGYWQYTFKDGWKYTALGIGANGVAISGSANGTDLYVAADNDSKRLFAGDSVIGGWKSIALGVRHLATMNGAYYTIADTGTAANSGVMKCISSTCTKLSWASGSVPAANTTITWKTIGASNDAVFLSDVSGRIHKVQGSVIALFGKLADDKFVVAFSKPIAGNIYLIGNVGGFYRMGPASVGLLNKSSVAVAYLYAAGIGPKFWVWDDKNTKVSLLNGGVAADVAAQPALGANDPACLPQKIWMVEDTAYISVCTPVMNSVVYTVWSASYQGDFKPISNLVDSMPVVAVISDGASGLLVMRSNGTTSEVKQLKPDGTLLALNIPLNAAEVLTGMSGNFFITNKGIRENKAPDYSLVKATTVGVQHPAASEDVLYFSSSANKRLVKFDSTLKMGVIADMGTQESIVDIVVDGFRRVYVLTAKTLYRYDNSMILTKIYDAPPFPMASMASMNGHHMLISMGANGMVLVDVNQKDLPLVINPGGEAGAGKEIWGVGYNGTEFLFFGRDVTTNTPFIHQYGAPQ